jgi:chloramphenicol O-acetyltransferase type A
MHKELNINHWNRKEHFEFFSQFDEPFFGIVAEMDCTNAYKICKENSIPFFLFYHFQSIRALNQIDEFKFRIINNEVIVFDTIHVTSTIGRKDNTFAFAFIPYNQSFDKFAELAKIELDRIKNTSGLGLSEDTGRLDVIHFSTVPWISFTGVTHARNFKNKDSVPKITFGKYFWKNERLMMPISVHVHHGLMDAYHVGKYLELLGQLMNGGDL